MKKWFKYALSLLTLRRALGTSQLFKAIKEDLHIEQVKVLNFKNVLILAPHPDDEVFGMGGVIKKLTESDAKVTVVYLCDGSHGLPEDSAVKRDVSLIDVREMEAKESGQILGVSKQLFWRYEDGSLAKNEKIVSQLKELILEVEPDIIFLPSFLDIHPDHRAANEILIATLDLLPTEKRQTKIWAYEVWSPGFVNKIVNISDVSEDKKKAIVAHASQLKSRGYDKAIIGLNQYRAESNNIPGFAESFLALPFETYKKLYNLS